MITCTTCKQAKPDDDFYVQRRRGKLDRQRRCKSCTRIGIDQWKEENPSKVAAQKWRHRLQNEYGIDEITYEIYFIRQNRKCAICHKESEDKLQVDHDHETGEVRGLLCRLCNIGLGHFSDDPSLLISAADYLKKIR